MTNPFARTFISYRRTKISEVELLAAALIERGVPVWQDTKNLGLEHTESEIRQVLNSEDIGSGCLWISNDYGSPIIQELEVPALFKRVRNKDGFFLAGVACDSQTYGDANSKLGKFTQSEEISEHNMLKPNTPFDDLEAQKIANRILAQRIIAIEKILPKDESLKVDVVTKTPQSAALGPALKVDWNHLYLNSKLADWQGRILESAKEIGRHLEKYAAGRVYEFSGFMGLGVSVAIGAVFSAPRQLKLSWKQQLPNQSGNQLWSLNMPIEESGYKAYVQGKDLGNRDLAVLVSVASDVMPAFQSSTKGIINFKAICEVRHVSGKPQSLANGNQAVDVATKIREAVIQAKSDYNSFDKIHLFMSVPAGLAVMVGQLSNTFGLIQTYEFVPSLPGGGGYVPALFFDSNEMR